MHVSKERIRLAPSSDDLASVFCIVGDILSHPVSWATGKSQVSIEAKDSDYFIAQLEDQDLKVLAYRC